MLGFNKNKKENIDSATKLQAIVLPLHTNNQSLDFLIELINKIRPNNAKNIEQAELKFKAILYQISQDKTTLFSLRKGLLSKILNTNIVNVLTESGIVSSRGFVQELLIKLKHKVLPSLQNNNDFLYVINKIFYKKNDFIWVEGVNEDLWKQFFIMIGFQININEPTIKKQIFQSLQLLSYRITSLGLEKEITHRFTNFGEAISPFLEQNKLINELIVATNLNNFNNTVTTIEKLKESLNNCTASLKWIKEQRKFYGTSLAQTYIITRLQQLIERLYIVLDVLNSSSKFNTERFVNYFVKVIHYENRKNSVAEFLSENTGYLAYQIAEHGGRTGERYITTSKKDFWKMFWSAAGGGFIISFIGVIKNLLGKMKLAPFWQGFLYSANYSLGFILIQDTGSTLATKQPAYTANNVASSLDINKIGQRPDLRNLAITVAKVSRTQLASFAGNLIIVFPISYALAYLYFSITGNKIVGGNTPELINEAHKLLIDQQPFNSFALLYACFTGFFLFASGIIAGYVENYMVYGNIGERLRNLSSFQNTFSKNKRHKIIHYIENNLGTLIGNISLGFFLGMAGFLGKIFGLPFDIRHITISAANTAIGFFGMGHLISLQEICYTLFGVFCIGFLNFAVSFGFAFLVAVKSRGIHLKDYPELLGILFKYFKKYPRDFIKAPKNRFVDQIN